MQRKIHAETMAAAQIMWSTLSTCDTIIAKA